MVYPLSQAGVGAGVITAGGGGHVAGCVEATAANTSSQIICLGSTIQTVQISKETASLLPTHVLTSRCSMHNHNPYYITLTF